MKTRFSAFLAAALLALTAAVAVAQLPHKKLPQLPPLQHLLLPHQRLTLLHLLPHLPATSLLHLRKK
jgi:hypothetical protein